MDRRTTRPRTKPPAPGNEVPSGSASVSAANGGGDDPIDPIEPDFPSSEGDIPVASLVVEEIKSNDAVTYKIGNVNGSEPGENVVVQGPVPDVVPSVPEEGNEEKREEKQEEGKEEGKEEADENGKESEEMNDVAVADSKPANDVVQSNGVAEIDEPVIAKTAGTEENSVEETAQAEVDEKPQIEEKEKPKIEEKEKPQIEEREKPKIEEKEKPKVNGGIAESPAASPPKKSRKARELNNLVSTLVGAETPIKDEPDAGDGPKSRSGRVLKLKTPSKDDEIVSPEKKRRREPKTPAKTGNGEPMEGEEKTPKVGRPRSTARVSTPGTKAESAPSGSVEVLKKAPEKRVVVFPFHQKIICSREDLLRIPVKIEEAEFFVGDLIWSKVTGYPYWPCMVTVDPLKGTYTELDEKSGEYTYHVQYFGDSATRSWTRPKGIFKFEGYDHYKSLEDPTPSTSASNTPSGKGGRGRSGKKGNPKYVIEPRYRKDWMAAVAEAELAMKMKGGSKERIESFTYIYEQSQKSDESSRKRRAGDSASTPSNGGPSKKRSKKAPNSSPEDVYDFDEEFDGDADLDEVSKSPLRLMSLKKKGDFTVFVARERSNLKKSNPGLKEGEIDRLLEKNWEFLPEDQKLKYVNRAGQSDSPALSEPQTSAVPTPPPLKIKLNNTVKPRTPACLIARKPRKSATPLKAAVEPASSNLDILDEPLVIDDIIAPAEKASTKKTPTRTRRGSKVSTNSK